jgi:hypothetical protein
VIWLLSVSVMMMGVHHRARVERRDLVVVGVRDDDGLGRVGVLREKDAARVDAQRAQALEIGRAVVAERGQNDGLAAERPQRVGDVPGAPAVFALQRGHEKRHIQDVQLLRKDLLGKAAVKRRDGVEGEGSADQGGHGNSGSQG